MVISLYISEIPKNVTKEDMNQLFKTLEGFKEIRMKISNNDKRKIAFVDYESESEAKFAQETLQGFKFSSEDKGINIKFSENNKNGSKLDKDKEKERDERDDSPKMLGRKRRVPSEEKYKKNKYSSNSNRDEVISSYPNKFQRDKIPTQQYNPIQTGNNTTNNINQSGLMELLSAIASTATTSNNINNQNLQTKPQDYPQNNQLLNEGQGTGNPNFELLTLLTNIQSMTNQNSNNSSSNNLNNLNSLSNINNLFQQSGTESNQQSNNQNNQKSSPKYGSNNYEYKTRDSGRDRDRERDRESSNGSSLSKKLMKSDDKFRRMLDLPKNATNIVYVEGLPLDTTEREIAHVFRPYKGFISVRLISRDKNGEKSIICFADFEDLIDATICINTLQGYRFDKNNLVGLHFSYGVNKHKR